MERHLFVDSSISTGLRNAYLLTAHGRLVGDPVSIERKYALKELPDGKAYVSVVSSEFLDERVDQERLGFKLTTQQREILDDAVMRAAERFLAEHIKTLRDRQRKTVEGLIYEHPQLATQFENIDDYVAGLSPGMDDEQIAQNLFVLLYRDEKDIRKKIDTLDHLASLEPEVREQAQGLLDEISNQEKHRLAELVVTGCCRLPIVNRRATRPPTRIRPRLDLPVCLTPIQTFAPHRVGRDQLGQGTAVHLTPSFDAGRCGLHYQARHALAEGGRH